MTQLTQTALLVRWWEGLSPTTRHCLMAITQGASVLTLEECYHLAPPAPGEKSHLPVVPQRLRLVSSR